MFDMFRWVAATIVLACHARSMFYGSYYDIESPTIIDMGLYSMTLFWHEAVMVFFVLSGYFIGTSVLKSISEDRFSWKHYLINRCSRLYIVLVPALVLTAILDHTGMTIFGVTSAYEEAAAHTSVMGWFASLFMAQPIYFPQFGSNGALWSLSFEFWYYLLFPAVCLVLNKKSTSKSRALLSIFIIALLLFMQFRMVAYFLVWLTGVVVAVAPIPALWKGGRFAYLFVGAVTLMGIIGIRALTHTRFVGIEDHWPKQLCADLLVALFFGLFCYMTKYYSLNRKEMKFPLSQLHKELADFSYTNYLIHLPILVFISACAVVKGGELLGKNRADIFLFVGLLIFVVFCAYVFSLFTERKTKILRNWLTRKLGLSFDRRKIADAKKDPCGSV